MNQIDVRGGGLVLRKALGIVPLAVLDLSVAQGFVPAVGTAFTVVNNRAAGVVNGIFLDLGEGTVFTTSGFSFRITYLGGDGNDVVVTRVA
jgi:hypothetical protein